MDGGSLGYELYILTEDGLCRAEHDGGEEALWFTEADALGVRTLHETETERTESLYLWEGTALRLSRRLSCGPLRTFTEEDGRTVEVTDPSQRRITVTEGDALLFDETVAPDETDAALHRAEEWME